MSCAPMLRFHVWCKQVEAEANPEVSEKLDIATVPTFVLLKVLHLCRLSVHYLLLWTMYIRPSYY